MRSILSLLIGFTLTGCGQDFFIANRAKFKISLSEQSVQVIFDLERDYQINIDKQIAYENLGEVFITNDLDLQTNSIGSKLIADTKNLSQTWPTVEMTNFPNKKSLPPSVGEIALKAWRKDSDHARWDLLYQSDPKLLNGGVLYSEAFNKLPRNFLAIQNFTLRNGEPIASISLFGPTKRSLGGILFVGNFGINPYKEDAESRIQSMAFALPSDTQEWQIESNEPAQIISSGEIWTLPLLDIKSWLKDLENELQGSN